MGVGRTRDKGQVKVSVLGVTAHAFDDSFTAFGTLEGSLYTLVHAHFTDF